MKSHNVSPASRPSVKPNTVFASLLLSSLLMGCATPSPVSIPVQPPATPRLPDTLAKPPSQESYLERARQNIEAWQQKLMDSVSK